MLNIVVLGAPCSGKGTQSLRIASFYNLSHISTGDIFREEIRNNTPVGHMVMSYINKGELVPDHIVLREIYRKATRKDGRNGFVFDGFPRTLNQARMLDKSLLKKRMKIDLVIFIDVGESELVGRMHQRSKNSQRTDDNPDVLARRIHIYRNQTFPLLNYYQKDGRLCTLSGMDSVESVFMSIRQNMDNYLNNK